MPVLCKKLLIGVGLCTLLHCAAAGPGEMVDMSLSPPADDSGTEGEQEPACFSGQPQTEFELLNRCTDAERIERAHRIPAHVWDGRGPLPIPPL